MNAASPINNDGYRDTLSVVDQNSGNRAWVFAKKPSGKLYRWRSWFSYLLMGLLFAGPFIRWNGHPILLLNVLDRKFILFGLPFWPQDLPLFALLMLTFIVFIIVFTVLFGRLWCGWACPQTIFMEMLFRKIEYWIEGDAKAQRKLKAQPWNTEKRLKKAAKHTLFFLLSFWIANTFLMYLIGADQVYKLAIQGPQAHIGKFVALVVFTAVFYLVFAKFREIVCIVICPYGRLQGLMLDQNSIMVAYDYKRGEPRGFKKKNATAALGHCVDCKRCVQVCPTGIDIRNGTQLECINCTACIDECNDVMLKTNQPLGLIRYASKNQIATGNPKFKITSRSAAYIAILALLTTLVAYLLATRSAIQGTLLRTPGLTYQQQDHGLISNMYNFEAINKSFNQEKITLKVKSPLGATLKVLDQPAPHYLLQPDGQVKSAFFVLLDPKTTQQQNIPIEIELTAGNTSITTLKSNFFLPPKP